MNMDEEKKPKFNLKFNFKKEQVMPLVIGLVVGLIIGLLIMLLIKPSKSLAKVNGGTITEKQVYNKLQKFYSNDVLTMILEDADNIILSKKYKEDDKMKEDIKKEAKNYLDSYKSYYGGSEEDFLKECGFDDFDDFAKYLSIEYKRNLYYLDYIAEVLGEEKIKEYYDQNNFGKIDVKHVLVKTSDDTDKKEAKKIADEIIAKLNDGANFDEVANEYKGKYEDIIVIEDLGELTFADSIEEAFMSALKAMEDNTYSKEPVETSYGYHVIYRKGHGDLSLKDAKRDIVKVLYGEVEAKSQNEKLIELRKEAGLKFSSKKFKEAYDEYCKKYVTEE